MGDTSKYKEEKQIALGILAHVDAGKTTLSESMLHKGGIVDNIGRVDKKNAFLDNYELEKERGITIFSKQAVFRIGNMRVTLLDTPGHIDFSAEMERTLQVLDYARACHQRGGRCAGTYQNALETPGALSDPGVFVYQQNGSVQRK